MMFKELDDAAYLARMEKHVEALNFAPVALPADRVRMHVCWGNYEGSHHRDVPLATILPTVLKAKPQGLLFETANPRHGHEWVTVRDMRSLVPQDKVLIPGVLDTTTHFIAHPELITQRVQRFVDNLNTHFVKSFVDVMGKREATKVLRRVRFHCTPKHASWLKMAEIEIGVLTRQCLNRRFGSADCALDELQRNVSAWQTRRNSERKPLRWKFTRKKVDEKLKRHYGS